MQVALVLRVEARNDGLRVTDRAVLAEAPTGSLRISGYLQRYCRMLMRRLHLTDAISSERRILDVFFADKIGLFAELGECHAARVAAAFASARRRARFVTSAGDRITVLGVIAACFGIAALAFIRWCAHRSFFSVSYPLLWLVSGLRVRLLSVTHGRGVHAKNVTFISDAKSSCFGH